MIKFAFIILNYNSTNETINCIEAIQKLSYNEKYIVVVDNASPNQDDFLEILSNYCSNMYNVHLLKSKTNTGYACGNNIGIDYARKVIRADYVCVINPDVTIKTENFVEKSIELNQIYQYAVCGPQIICGGINSNPLGGYKESILTTIYHLYENCRIILVKKLGLAKFNFIKKGWKRIFEVKTTDDTNIFLPTKKEENLLLNKDMEKQLSGACLIFSPLFFKEFTGLCDKTFLYCEETILTCVCLNCEYNILYTPELITGHEGGKSIKCTVIDDISRQIYISQIGAHSCMVWLGILLHKKNREYLRKCLNPSISDYDVVK